MGPPSRRCLRLVDASGVDYALLHEPAAARGADLDLAVRASDLARLERALTSSYRIVRRARYEARSWGLALVEREGPDARATALDLTLDYRWGGRVFFSEAELLKHRRREGGSWRLGEEQEWRYLLVKRFYEKRSLRAGDQRRMAELAAQLGKRAETAAVSLLGAEGARAVSAAAHGGDWSRLDGAFEGLARAMALQALLSDPPRVVRYWIDEAARVIARLLAPSGLAIAALGPDGAGKTTLLDALEADLPGIFRRTLRFHFLPRRTRSRSAATDRPHEQAPHGRTLCALKAAYYSLVWTVGWIGRVAPARRATTAVLFDRCLDDLAADPARYRFHGPGWAADWAARLLPRPDLTLVLDLDPARALERKSETSCERLAALRRRYLCMGLDRADVALIDASGAAAQTHAQALEAILEKLEERCGRSTPRRLPAVRARLADSLAGRGISLSLSGERRLWLPAEQTVLRGGLRALWRPLGRLGRTARALTASLPGAVFLGFGARAEAPPFERADEVFDAVAEVLGCADWRFAALTRGCEPTGALVVALDECGEAKAFARVAWRAESRLALSREEQALKRFADMPTTAFKAPRLLGRIEKPSWAALLTAPLEIGDPQSSKRLGGRDVAALLELGRRSSSNLSLGEAPFWRGLRERIARQPRRADFGLLSRAIEVAAEAAGAHAFRFGAAHGDYAPWNRAAPHATCRDGLALWDWESYREDAPPGYDGYHFLTQSWLLAGGPSLFDDLRSRSSVEALLVDAGACASDWALCYTLYLLDRLSLPEPRSGTRLRRLLLAARFAVQERE